MGLLLYVWDIPPKVAPVPENTVFAIFADIIKLFCLYSYLNFHTVLLEHFHSKSVWLIHDKNIF